MKKLRKFFILLMMCTVFLGIKANASWADENQREDFNIVNNVLISYKGKDKSVVIPSNVTIIGESAFEGCENLLKVTLSNKLTLLNSYMFTGCVSLKDIIIPDSITNMGEAVFENCTNLSNA